MACAAQRLCCTLGWKRAPAICGVSGPDRPKLGFKEAAVFEAAVEHRAHPLEHGMAEATRAFDDALSGLAFEDGAIDRLGRLGELEHELFGPFGDDFAAFSAPKARPARVHPGP